MPYPVKNPFLNYYFNELVIIVNKNLEGYNFMKTKKLNVIFTLVFQQLYRSRME